MSWEILTRRSIAWNELEALQESLKAKVLENSKQAFFLLSEPLPTFTSGKQADPSDLLWDSDLRLKNQVEVAPVSRGGKWTFHGPGQLLCYPIVHLEALGLSSKSSRAFVETLRSCVQKTCDALGITSQPREEPFGLYWGNKKLASFGMSFQGGVSSHGVALYLSSQKNYFEGIHPCGQKECEVISLQEAGASVSWNDAAATLVSFLEKGFKLP